MSAVLPAISCVRSAVESAIAAHVPQGEPVCIALSGGMDSVVLLDALTAVAKGRNPISAIHVHHGLSPNADAWAAFCDSVCKLHTVKLEVKRVNVTPGGRGLEDAAREARYAVFNLCTERWILQGHHADDQVETLLLRLNRGTGLKGLAGIPAIRELGAGRHLLRPFIRLPRPTLFAYAQSRALQWIEDESNGDLRLDRNYLRARVLPVIAERFPAYRQNWQRTVEHAASAQRLLDELAAIDVGKQPAQLSVKRMRSLLPDRFQNALRYFLSARGVDAPDAVHLADVERRIRESRSDATLAVRIGAHALMQYRGSLQLVPVRLTEDPPPVRQSVQPGQRTAVPTLAGALSWQQRTGEGIAAHRLQGADCVLRSAQESERLRTDPKRPTRTLKNLFQECAIPPWERNWLARIEINGELVWVDRLGFNCAWQASQGEAGWLPVWEPGPD